MSRFNTTLLAILIAVSLLAVGLIARSELNADSSEVTTVGVIGAMMGGVLGAAATAPWEALQYIREGEQR